MTSKTKKIVIASVSAIVIIGVSVFLIRLFTYSLPRQVTGKSMNDGSVYTGTIQRRMRQGFGQAVYRDSSIYSGQFNLDKREGAGTMIYTDGSTYEGSWKEDLRDGSGKFSSSGTTYEGEWAADSLHEGTVTSPEYIYDGELRDLLPNGFGRTRHMSGETYIGNYLDGYRHGAGKLISPDRTFKFGMWDGGILNVPRDKAFKDGSKIYGVDISHHQPEIDWDNMMLYADNNGDVFYKKARGRYNYPVPVSFVFLKAAEVIQKDSIIFFVDSDYQKNADLADKHHIVKGSYLFYKYGVVEPEVQIRHFIDNSRYDDGDLPPVLDVEMSITQVYNIGKELVQKDVLECLRIIERERGVKPILYASRSVYNSYLDAPEFKEYDLWIARYGSKDAGVDEHRFWQFSAYGELGGMDLKSNIDIDIFNGDVNDWNRYLDKIQRKKY